MKRKSIIALLFVATLFITTTGCQGPRLAEGGAYQDPVLFQADKTIVRSKQALHRFVSWEYTNRTVLPVEVSRAADEVRKNADRWINTAMNLREAYAFNPNNQSRSQLDKAIDVLLTALLESSNYILQYGASQSTPVPQATPARAPTPPAAHAPPPPAGTSTSLPPRVP